MTIRSVSFGSISLTSTFAPYNELGLRIHSQAAFQTTCYFRDRPSFLVGRYGRLVLRAARFEFPVKPKVHQYLTLRGLQGKAQAPDETTLQGNHSSITGQRLAHLMCLRIVTLHDHRVIMPFPNNHRASMIIISGPGSMIHI